MWYFPLLKPYVDHVPVKADLSDLEEKIRWCRENDEKCRIIGENAKKFYDRYVGRDALLDYVEMCCKQISKRYIKPPGWWSEPPSEELPPKLRKPDVPCYQGRDSKKSRFCTRCQDAKDKEERELQEAEARAAHEKKDVKKRKTILRDRMRRKAVKT